MNFGEHITIDGYGGNEKLLNNKKLILSCLNNLPTILGMKKISKPEVYFVKGNNKKDPGGWSGFVVIEESHISIHTFPRRRFISADVYSCKNDMNLALIKRYFKQKFELKELETNFIKRGTRYPVKNF